MEIDLRPDVVTVAATREDGGLTVSRFVTQEYRAPTDEEQARGITEKVPNGRRKEITPAFVDEIYARKARDTGKVIVRWRFVPNDYLDEDTDDTFRNAWKHTEGMGKPDHDMPKAREIHRAYLRKARLAEFCRLDNDYRIADEADNKEAKRTIGALRQKFRDVTADPRIEAAQTVEELKALRLEVMIPETVGERYMLKFKISPAIPGVVEPPKPAKRTRPSKRKK